MFYRAKRTRPGFIAAMKKMKSWLISLRYVCTVRQKEQDREMSQFLHPESRQDLLESLRASLGRIEGARHLQGGGLIGSGHPVLDQLLPRGGVERGSLVEWLSTDQGSGAGTIALRVAREAARGGGAIVVMDRQHAFYPVAAAGMGIDLQRLIVVLTRNQKDELWAIDQALRCSGVAAVWAPLEQLHWRSFRRLQLAAESGEAIGLLIRPAKVRGQPSWSHLRLLVEPQPQGITSTPTGTTRRVRVELLRGRSSSGLSAVGSGQSAKAATGMAVELEIEMAGEAHHETHTMSRVSQLARSKARRRSAGT